MENRLALNKNIISENGFTLIELLVTVVIIGILSAVAVPMYTRHITNAKAAEALVQMQVLVGYAQAYTRAHPQDWSQTGMMLGEDATGTATMGDGDWVENMVHDNVYFNYDYNAATQQVRAWGKAAPFDVQTGFPRNGDKLLATIDNQGNVTWSANGRLEEILP